MKWFDYLTGVWLVADFLSLIFMGIWATFDAITEPTHEQVQYYLSARFGEWEKPLSDLNLRPEGNGHYTGTAKSLDGSVFRVTAELRPDGLSYTAKAENGGHSGSMGYPGFLDRHSWSAPLLDISVFFMGVFGFVFALAGLVGLRERFRLWIEIVLYVCAIPNLCLAYYCISRYVGLPR